jgi:predicted transcriptional regulator
MKIMPQEMEVWYLLPAIRKELVKIFKQNYNLTQKKSAELLDLTESAVSQYTNSKRAQSLIFSKQEIEKVKKAAQDIITDPKNKNYYLFKLSKSLKGSKSLCEIHRKKDSTISKTCDLCMR